LKNIFFFFCYYLGITPLFLFVNKRKQRIITYHHILPDHLVEDSLLYGYTHRLSSFKKQLFLLDKVSNCATIFGKPNSFILTFDDGAKNNYTYVFPLLKEFNLKAYFFILDSCINSQELLWTDKWFLWLSKAPEGNYTLFDSRISIGDKKSRQDAHILLWRVLQKNYSKRRKIIEEMNINYPFEKFQSYIEASTQRFKFLELKEIAEMKENGNLIGFHGFSHDIMSCQQEGEITEELTAIKQNKIYNTPSYAVPFGTEGHYNKKIIKQLTDQGFTPILLNQENNPHENCLPRINIPDTENRYEIYFYLSGLNLFLSKFR
jgi:hypothetical protein